MGVALCKLVAEALQEIVRPEVDHVCEVEGKNVLIDSVHVPLTV